MRTEYEALFTLTVPSPLLLVFASVALVACRTRGQTAAEFQAVGVTRRKHPEATDQHEPRFPLDAGAGLRGPGNFGGKLATTLFRARSPRNVPIGLGIAVQIGLKMCRDGRIWPNLRRPPQLVKFCNYFGAMALGSLGNIPPSGSLGFKEESGQDGCRNRCSW